MTALISCLGGFPPMLLFSYLGSSSRSDMTFLAAEALDGVLELVHKDANRGDIAFTANLSDVPRGWW